MHRVFVYGTLKRGQPNHYLVSDAKNGIANFIGPARTVKRWPLVTFTPYCTPFMLDKPDMGKVVYGELFDVNESMLATLDRLESHPTLYRRSPIEVELLHDNVASPEEVEIVVPPVVEKCEAYLLTDYVEEMESLEMLHSYSDKVNTGYILPGLRADSAPLKQFVKK